MRSRYLYIGNWGGLGFYVLRPCGPSELDQTAPLRSRPALALACGSVFRARAFEEDAELLGADD